MKEARPLGRGRIGSGMDGREARRGLQHTYPSIHRFADGEQTPNTKIRLLEAHWARWPSRAWKRAASLHEALVAGQGCKIKVPVQRGSLSPAQLSSAQPTLHARIDLDRAISELAGLNGWTSAWLNDLAFEEHTRRQVERSKCCSKLFWRFVRLRL